MFIRQQFRTKNGQRHAYWALVESYRTASGLRQRVVAWLGKLDEAGRPGVKQAAEAFDEIQGRENSDGSTATRRPQPLTQHLQFDFDDEPALQPRCVDVNAGGVRVENMRLFGGPWMALHLIRMLQLDTLFQTVMEA